MHQLLSKALSKKEAEKVEVQKELHELQIKSRDTIPLGLNLRDIDHDVVHNIIEDMEKNSIGRCNHPYVYGTLSDLLDTCQPLGLICDHLVGQHENLAKESCNYC